MGNCCVTRETKNERETQLKASFTNETLDQSNPHPRLTPERKKKQEHPQGAGTGEPKEYFNDTGKKSHQMSNEKESQKPNQKKVPSFGGSEKYEHSPTKPETKSTPIATQPYDDGNEVQEEDNNEMEVVVKEGAKEEQKKEEQVDKVQEETVEKKEDEVEANWENFDLEKSGKKAEEKSDKEEEDEVKEEVQAEVEAQEEEGQEQEEESEQIKGQLSEIPEHVNEEATSPKNMDQEVELKQNPDQQIIQPGEPQPEEDQKIEIQFEKEKLSDQNLDSHRTYNATEETKDMTMQSNSYMRTEEDEDQQEEKKKNKKKKKKKTNPDAQPDYQSVETPRSPDAEEKRKKKNKKRNENKKKKKLSEKKMSENLPNELSPKAFQE